MDAKKRQRTTKKQFEIIVNYLEANKELVNNEKGLHFNESEKKWRTLTDQLNSQNIGPQKTQKEWRNVSSFLFSTVTYLSYYIAV